MEDNPLMIDFIQFGYLDSEAQRLLKGEFSCPQDLRGAIKDDRAVQESCHAEIMRWRDASDTIGFSMNIPEGAVLKDLRLELCLKRYAHRGYDRPVQPTLIHIVTQRDVYSCDSVFLPCDGEWHSYTIPLKDIAYESLASEIIFFIKDSANFKSTSAHFGISFSYAKLLCRDRASIIPEKPKKNIRSSAMAGSEVMLVMCPVWDLTVPPVSIACLASYLRSKGIHPTIFDFNIESFYGSSKEMRFIWHGQTAGRWSDPVFVKEALKFFSRTTHEAAERIARSGAGIIGFSIYSTNYHCSLEVAKKIKRISPDKIIVWGGPGIIFLGDDIKRSSDESVDFLVIGDGEKALYDIVTGKKDLPPGVIRKQDFKNHNFMSKRHSEPDLNDLPLLDYEGINISKYIEWHKLPAYTSRGCIRRCSYCFDWNYYHPFRYLKGELAFEHLMNLYNKYKRKYFELSDLLCNGNLPALLTMSKMLAETGKGIEWGGFAVIRPDMTASFFRTLKAGGCDYLRYGFETGSTKLLHDMKRGYSSEVASRIMNLTHESGIKVRINILLGMPGENDGTVDETLRFLKSNASSIDRVESVNLMTMMPSTELLDHSRKFSICPSEDGSWATPQHNFQKRQEWGRKVIAGLNDYGIPCHAGMIEAASS